MTDDIAEAPAAPMPLFYAAPEPLSAHVHRDWRLTEGDHGFAADTPSLPILAAEIPLAARDYPIVFAAGRAAPLAILGLDAMNLFVAGGRWDEQAYIPAYVRRYPFAFMATPEPDRFQLAIDTGSAFLIREGEEGSRLFDGDEPSALTRRALEFCTAFGRDARATDAFADALVTQDLLIERRADATLPDGRRLGLDGFQIVDAEKFAALPDDVVLDWHRRGWLALIHFHLASLDRFPLLLRRRAALTDATAAESVGPTEDSLPC